MTLLNNATRASTRSKYRSTENKWLTHCRQLGIDPHIKDTLTFLNFLAINFDKNLRWATLRGYIPALSEYLQKIDMLQVRRLLKGAFNLRPPVAKYTVIWDVNVVLEHMESMPINSLKHLTMKLATLFMLLSGNRVNMLSHMKLTCMYLTEQECTFVFDEALKHSRPSLDTSPMIFRSFPDIPALCPVKLVGIYLGERNKLNILKLSDDASFFITTVSPYKRPAPATIARWIKDTLTLSGIDSGKYTAHSCRSASTSNAALHGISLSTILKSACWSNVKTFKKFYFREISRYYNLENQNFGQKTLEAFNNNR